jgi:AcrR family transcriptional regulator
VRQYSPAVPVTRKEQRERTREVLLDAAMMSLVEHGYAGTTTQRVQERAGVSRGALLHHFASKAELLVAATRHIADLRLARIRGIASRAESLGQVDARRQVVKAMHEAMTGPPFQAAMELWIASRTDPELREASLPAERRLGVALREVFDEFVHIDDADTAEVRFESLLALFRGLELARIIVQDASAEERVIEQWLADLDAADHDPIEHPPNLVKATGAEPAP